MTGRITRKHAEAALEKLAKVAGFPLYKSKERDGLAIVKNSGFEIETLRKDLTGGSGTPFGYESLTAKELFDRLTFARRVVEKLQDIEKGGTL